MDWSRTDARDTFLLGFGPHINWHCNIDQHLKAIPGYGGRPSTPYFDVLDTQPAPSEGTAQDTVVDADLDATKPDDDLEDDSNSITAANETWSNTEVSANDDRPKDEEWDLNAEAPDFKRLG